MVKRLDGVLKMEENGKFVQNEKGIPPHVVRPGYPTDYARDEFVTPNPDRFRVKTKEEFGQTQMKHLKWLYCCVLYVDGCFCICGEMVD